jgi:hypothetical protein
MDPKDVPEEQHESAPQIPSIELERQQAGVNPPNSEKKKQTKERPDSSN